MSAKFFLDLLDEFNVEAAKQQSTPSGTGGGAETGGGGEDMDGDFARELQKGMADLLGELESSVFTSHFFLLPHAHMCTL